MLKFRRLASVSQSPRAARGRDTVVGQPRRRIAARRRVRLKVSQYQPIKTQAAAHPAVPRAEKEHRQPHRRAAVIWGCLWVCVTVPHQEFGRVSA